MMGRPTGAHVFGPLQPLVRGFLLELIELGYGWGPQSERLRLMAQLSAWMAREGIEPPELTASLIGEFLAPLRAQGPKRGWFSPTSERQLVDYLRRLGLVAESQVPAVTDPVELVIDSFVEYLVRERGLSVDSTSVYEYKRIAGLFLSGRVAADGGLDDLSASDITAFVLEGCRQRSYRMSVGLVSSLRGLLRFLFVEGLTPFDLSGAVPGVAKWRAASLPRAIPAEQVARIVAGCDRTTVVGRRDFAVLTMLARLGV